MQTFSYNTNNICKYLQEFAKKKIKFVFNLIRRMLKEERQKLILDKLSTAKKINLGDLSTSLKVSYDSIRRDVIELEDKGLLKKVHGGVVSNSYLNILGGQRKGILNGGDLKIVMAKALKLIKRNQVILMDGGTTNFFLAEQIPRNIPLTLITNSPPLAMALNNHENIEIVLLGGKYYKRYQVTMGLEVIRSIQSFNIDLFFMGANGVEVAHGLTIRNYEESMLKRLMMQAAKETVCCVVEEKIGIVENYQICGIEQVNRIITNLQPNHTLLKDFPIEKLL
jgi:DeoR/GlpR family transcriptional regulator of sugar metabolism